MATDNLAKQLSCSWYIPGGAAEPAVEVIFQQMAAQGQSFFTASGDSDAYTGLIPFPSDSPSITTVGGTTLTTAGPGGAYVSESVWNWGLDNGEYVGSSGGISTNYALPTWQQGIGMTANLGSTTMRNVPDVALTGDNVWVTYDNGGSGSFGGTSCAAPLWAAFTALVNQQAAINGQPAVGFLNPALYSVGLGASYGTNFHDVTTGNNFSASSPNKFPAVAGFDLATGLGSPMGTSLIAALAGPPDALLISGTDLVTNGPAGGPFIPASTTYTLKNSGASSLNWNISPSQTWLSVSPAAGNLDPGASVSVSVGPNSAANSLNIGSYHATLSVVDATTGVTQARPVALAVLGPPSMTVSPSGAFTSQGSPGGPFTPSSVTYTITNTGAPSLNWTASNSSNWLSLSSSGGTLAAGASTTVTASIAAPANTLGLGTYNDSIIFTNTTNGAGNTTASATLGVVNEVQVAQPPQLTTYSPMVRGYWFTSPATFVISGLQVPTDASSGPQSIAVLKLTSTPPLYPSTTNTFTTLFLTQNNPASGIIPVTIQVNQGDIIGILGCRAEINSYGAAPFSTQILGQPVTMARFGMQFPLDTTVPQSVWTDTTTGYLSRVNMYITGSTTAPIITSAFSASATFAQPFSYQIAATNSPTSYNATGLPSGLSVNTSTGVISGTPAATGTSNVTMSATNASGTGTATLTINVLAAPPVITSALTASGNTATPFSYAITASNSPTSYSATGLPSGLSVNTSTGVISGAPSAAGTSNVTISATNSGGTGSATLVLSIALGAPAITSPLSATATLNTTFSYSIAATGSPTSYNATGLPAGLSVNTSTGLISGTPTALGTSNVSLSATNSVGTGTATLVLTVAQPAPVITSSTNASGVLGTPFSYTITATNSPLSYNAIGLPAGLSVNTSTGVISGTPTASGSTSVTISATNAGGTGSTTLFLSISQPPPVITSPLTASATVNASFSYTTTSTGSPYNYAASPLPSGLSINSSTGVISGTPLVTGTTTIALSATGSSGTGNANLVLTVAPSAPTITSRLNVGGAANAPFTYTITALNNPTSFAATGLPAGWTFNPNTGVISGTPATTGSYNIVLGATNAVGTGNALLTLTFSVASPVTASAFYYNGVGYVAGAGGGSGLDLPVNGSVFSGSENYDQGVSIAINGPGSTTWEVDTAAPGSVLLTLGSYMGATRFPFQGTSTPGLSWYGNGSGDNQSIGAFNILDIQYGANSTITSYAADFVQFDELAISSWDVGSIRYNSSVPVSYPAPPVINSSTAAPGNATSEILTATVNPSGPPTTVYFQYGLTSAYGSATPNQSLIAGVTGSPVSATITSLQAATTYHYQVVASSTWGTTTSADATFTTGSGAPVVFSPASAGATQGQVFTYQILASNSPSQYAASGLPDNLTLNTTTGLISGTPSQTGSYPVTLSATNGAGTGSVTLLLIVAGPQPAITSPLTAAANSGDPFNYTITATNSPTSYSATGLPAGLSINTSTGVISGAPTAAGTSNITISATNSFGSGSATLVLTATTIAPVITSSSFASATLNSPFNYAITASNGPASYNAVGLPAGLSVNTSTGVISGTPTVAGYSSVTIGATNASGTGSATLTIDVVALTPVITSSLTASGTTGVPFTYTITASNNPTSYSASGLPSGLSVNTSTGVISGTPVVAGTSNVTIGAQNSGGSSNMTLVLTIALGQPTITSSLSATAIVNSAFSYSITATGSPTSYSASGLPAGLTVNTGTGVISGAATAIGTSNVTIGATNSLGTGSATNAGGTGSTTLHLTIIAPPIITSATTASGSTGTAFTYTITATNSPTSYNATGLPAGLSVNTSTGVISGTPTVAGTSNVTISAPMWPAPPTSA
ncbi:MAG: putative Ig domain-containing protein [Chthoniobacter sp.]|nr:putative Ig domain-containing protein [Chthoniobacter sp.]